MMFLDTFFRAGQAWHEETLKTLKLNITEFLQEETRDLPAPAEMDLFYQQIAQLEIEAANLLEKIHRLEDDTK